MVESLGETRKGRRESIGKGCHCFFKSSGYDKLELKHQNLFFENYGKLRLWGGGGGGEHPGSANVASN